MNTNKHQEFFAPQLVTENIHIIGCGAIGSTLAMYIAKMGIENIILYDEDIVEDKNVANQMYCDDDIGKPKTEALKEYLIRINPLLERTIKTKPFYKNEKLDGYVFMAVDSIKVRRKIVESNKFNLKVKAMFDFRMRLEDAQHYAADWSSVEMKDELLATMDFTEEEAAEQTPRSACNEVLSFFPTITAIAGEGIWNFVHFVKDRKSIKKMILYSSQCHYFDAF